MDNINKFNKLVYDLEHELKRGVHTFSRCPRCKEKGSRGELCTDCIFAEIAVLADDDNFAASLVNIIKHKENLLETIENRIKERKEKIRTPAQDLRKIWMQQHLE